MDREGVRVAGDGPALQPGQAMLAIERIARQLGAAEEALGRQEPDRAQRTIAAAEGLLAMLARGGLLPAERKAGAVSDGLRDLQTRVARLSEQIANRASGGTRVDCSG
jgi:hypothetical protein